MFGQNPYTQAPQYGIDPMEEQRKKKQGGGGMDMLSLMSPLGSMFADHPHAALAMLSPLAFGLTKLFK